MLTLWGSFSTLSFDGSDWLKLGTASPILHVYVLTQLDIGSFRDRWAAADDALDACKVHGGQNMPVGKGGSVDGGEWAPGTFLVGM